jgi:hypothetical protein
MYYLVRGKTAHSLTQRLVRAPGTLVVITSAHFPTTTVKILFLSNTLLFLFGISRDRIIVKITSNDD